MTELLLCNNTCFKQLRCWVFYIPLFTLILLCFRSTITITRTEKHNRSVGLGCVCVGGRGGGGGGGDKMHVPYTCNHLVRLLLLSSSSSSSSSLSLSQINKPLVPTDPSVIPSLFSKS